MKLNELEKLNELKVEQSMMKYEKLLEILNRWNFRDLDANKAIYQIHKLFSEDLKGYRKRQDLLKKTVPLIVKKCVSEEKKLET